MSLVGKAMLYFLGFYQVVPAQLEQLNTSPHGRVYEFQIYKLLFIMNNAGLVSHISTSKA